MSETPWETGDLHAELMGVTAEMLSYRANSFTDVGNIFRRRIWAPAVTVLICGATGYFYPAFMPSHATASRAGAAAEFAFQQSGLTRGGMLAVGIGAGLVLGLCFMLVQEARDKAIRTPRDVEVRLQLPLLAQVPLVDAAGEASELEKGRRSSGGQARIAVML